MNKKDLLNLEAKNKPEFYQKFYLVPRNAWMSSKFLDVHASVNGAAKTVVSEAGGLRPSKHRIRAVEHLDLTATAVDTM